MKIKQIIENSKINIDKNQIRYDEPMKNILHLKLVVMQMLHNNKKI